MTNVLVDDSYLSDIADTIRAKLGVADTYLPSEMADAIDDIGGGVTPTGTKQISISANGTTTEDVAVYASAEITVAVPSASLGTKSITENGTYNASSDSLDGYSSVTVNVSGGASVLSGSFTPESDANTYTISALAGTTLNHFLLFGLPADVIGHSKREIGLGYVDYDKNIFYSSASNSTGTAIGTAGGAAIASGNQFRFDRTTGTINLSTGSNGGGYLIGGVTYYWFAW